MRTADLEQREEALLRTIGQLGARAERAAQGGGRTAGAPGRNRAGRSQDDAAPVLAWRSSRASAPTAPICPTAAAWPLTPRAWTRWSSLISANPGEPLKPMARVASGGETARLMLALKSTLAHADATPTLIFDEIDQGHRGGRVGADGWGRKLWALTREQ